MKVGRSSKYSKKCVLLNIVRRCFRNWVWLPKHHKIVGFAFTGFFILVKFVTNTRKFGILRRFWTGVDPVRLLRRENVCDDILSLWGFWLLFCPFSFTLVWTLRD